MRRILMTFLCLTVCPLLAEVIGHVEYSLPNGGKGWKMDSTHEGSEKIKSTTTVYVPEKTNKKDVREFFGVHLNYLSNSSMDQASLEKSIQLQFPGKSIQLDILEQSPRSVLYEWRVNDLNQEIVHGWTRGITHQQENVILLYQTRNIKEVDKVRPIWLRTLKNAKLIN